MPCLLNDKLSLWAARSVERLRRLVKRRNPLVHLCAGGDGSIDVVIVDVLKRLPTAIARMVRMTAVSFMFPLAVAA